ncbi:MAG TPA: hypothetical protein VM425_08530 [Myxococcota bacterium]|nr:hypothetical protein [Myxococcota bacterium]
MKISVLICLALLLGLSGCLKSHDSAVADGRVAVGQDGQSGSAGTKETVAVPPRGEMKDGRQTGAWTFFHANGKKSAEGEYSDGLKNGQWTFWDEAGQKIAEGAYLKGRKDGKWTDWDEQGKQLSERLFKNGQEVYK